MTALRESYCGLCNDGQVPWAKMIFYSLRDTYTHSILVHLATLGSTSSKNERLYTENNSCYKFSNQKPHVWLWGTSSEPFQRQQYLG